MKEQITYYYPYRLKSADTNDEYLAKKSEEKEEHDKRISTKLKSVYFNDKDIPEQPEMSRVINNNNTDQTHEPNTIPCEQPQDDDF